MTATDAMTFGLLGCGFFGRALATELVRLPGASLAAVADVQPENAASAAEQFGAEAVGPEELMRQRGLDAILIATPNDLHVEPVLAAVKAGLAVFVEKPMALTPSDCAVMQAAADEAGVPLVVGHILRTLPVSLRLKRLLEDNALGEIVSAHGALSRWLDRSSAPADWWKLDATRTGGELLHEIHVLDLLCWLLGDMDTVQGLTGAAQSSVVMRRGPALITYDLSSANRFPQWGLEIHGSSGSAKLDLRTAELQLVTDTDASRWGVFEDEKADESLRASATAPHRYNRAGGATPLWMATAISLELKEVLAIFGGRTDSALLEAPDRAVAVAAQVSSA